MTSSASRRHIRSPACGSQASPPLGYASSATTCSKHGPAKPRVLDLKLLQVLHLISCRANEELSREAVNIRQERGGVTFFGFFWPSAPPTSVAINGNHIDAAAQRSNLENMENAMSKKSLSKGSAKTSMTKSDAARIQSATAKSNGGQVSRGSFASRAARAAARSSK